MTAHKWIAFLAVVAIIFSCGPGGESGAQQKNPGYSDTPFLPDGKWRVHDNTRPEPVLVTPGKAAGAAPSDAIVLFDGKDLSKWRDKDGNPSGWIVKDGAMIVPPKKKGQKHGSHIYTRDKFGDCQLHIEWASPLPATGDSQHRGNSGVYFMERYEVQVLDSYENRTYSDGQAGSLYGQCPPLVNACVPPGEWQVYDIIWRAPRFQDGKCVEKAKVTVIHNGVVLHHAREMIGISTHRKVAKYTEHDPKGSIYLQDHTNPVRYRNIWIRPLKDYDAQ